MLFRSADHVDIHLCFSPVTRLCLAILLNHLSGCRPPGHAAPANVGSLGAGVFWADYNTCYLLCNADEMEPGTYKDRLLMEQLPHLLVEGMLISAFALKAYRGYIFLRGEYIEAAVNLRRAIAEATEAGLLGKNIMGTEIGRAHV